VLYKKIKNEGKIMKQNVGTSDQYIRFIFGVAFIMNIFTLNSGVALTIILLALAVSMFYSSYTKYCFMYDILKIRSCATGCKCSNEATSRDQ
jgi:hypothetical protein